MSREILFPQSAPDAVNFAARRQTQDTVASQRLVPPGGLVDSHPTRNNYALTPAHYGNYVGKMPAVMQGAPGTTLGTGNYHSTVQAATVQHTDAVTVHSTAQAQWVTSQFASVTVKAGAKVKYIGCRFTGVLDNSAGNAADVQCVGCFFDVPPVNVVQVG